MKGSCGWLEDMYDRKAATLMAEALLQLPNLIRSCFDRRVHTSTVRPPRATLKAGRLGHRTGP